MKVFLELDKDYEKKFFIVQHNNIQSNRYKTQALAGIKT